MRAYIRNLFPLVSPLFSLTLPTFFPILLEFIIPIVTTLMIGRLGKNYLAAGSLGGMIVNASGYSITFGMASALDMMCSHAFGSKEYRLVGLYTQRGMVILTFICIPIACLWMFTEKLLLMCNINPDVAHLAHTWVIWQILALWPVTMANVLRKFLISQSIVFPQIFGMIIGAIIHLVLTYCLVNMTSLGFFGAIIVIPITTWIIFFTIIMSYIGYYMYMKRNLTINPNIELDDYAADGSNDSLLSHQHQHHHPHPTHHQLLSFDDSDEEAILDITQILKEKDRKEVEIDSDYLSLSLEENLMGSNEEVDSESKEKEEIGFVQLHDAHKDVLVGTDHLETWPSLSFNIFTGWGEFLILGIPAAVSLFLEWGSFEVNAILISLSIPNSTLSNSSTPLAVHALLASTSMIWYMVPTALAAATTTLIGNSLGSGDSKNAKNFAIISFTIIIFYSTLNGGLALAYRFVWFKMWTSDEAVIELGSSCMYIMWFYHISDCLKCISIAIVRGCGKYTHTVVVNAIACIAVGYPISYICGIHLGYGVKGVWLGMACAWFMASVIYCIIILTINWEQESIDSRSRTKEGLLSIQNFDAQEAST